MKFSIIVPVYNVENYIEKCLESIETQTYDNYEVIIVDDGSEDNSSVIVEKFIKGKPKFRCVRKENGGLSDARNYGLDYITGDYILFVDSDDYIEKELLENLTKEIQKEEADVIKFNLNFVEDNNVRCMNKQEFRGLHPDKAIELLLMDELFEPAWLYCYKASFWKKHEFKYTKGRIHEDYGLTPLVLMEAKKISSIDYIGYNYVIRNNSIMTSKNPEKDYKKFCDCFSYFEENESIIEKSENVTTRTKKILLSFYANGVLNRAKCLNGDYKKKALAKLREKRIYKYLDDSTTKRKVKKFFVKYFLNLYALS